MFWAVHHAASAIMGDAGSDAANDFKASLETEAYGELESVPVSHANEDQILQSIGAKSQ